MATGQRKNLLRSKNRSQVQKDETKEPLKQTSYRDSCLFQGFFISSYKNVLFGLTMAEKVI